MRGTIVIQGEDGEIWRWVFRCGGMYEQNAVIAWPSEMKEVAPGAT